MLAQVPLTETHEVESPARRIHLGKEGKTGERSRRGKKAIPPASLENFPPRPLLYAL